MPSTVGPGVWGNATQCNQVAYVPFNRTTHSEYEKICKPTQCQAEYPFRAWRTSTAFTQAATSKLRSIQDVASSTHITVHAKSAIFGLSLGVVEMSVATTMRSAVDLAGPSRP